MNKVPKVLVADPISNRGVEALRGSGEIDVVVQTGMTEAEIIGIIPEYDGIVVRSQTKITDAILTVAKRLKVVGRAGVGIDNVNVESATKYGVIVMNAPGGNTISTAEHAFSLLLAIARHISAADASMKEGQWNRKKFEGVQLHGKILAILGMGRIGTEVAKRALIFGMHVIAYDPYLSTNKSQTLQIEIMDDLHAMLAQADFITLHMPLTQETHHIIGKKEFSFLKKGVRLINCARGGLVDEIALAEALNSDQIAAAALDVFETEPPVLKNWSGVKNILLTPHLGASTAEAQELVGIEIAESVRATLLKGEIKNSVNMPNIDSKTLCILAPWIELGRKLGSFLAQIAPKRTEKLLIRYSGRILDFDLIPLTRYILVSYLTHICGNYVNLVNTPAILESLGLEVIETRETITTEFTDLIEVAIIQKESREIIRGTLYGDKPRIVALNGYHIEGVPLGTILLLEHRDRLGIIGYLGSILGKCGVNIANMSLSRTEVGGKALTLLNLDTKPSDSILAEIMQDNDIISARFIQL